MINVFLLLGSNLGERNLFLHRAIEHIEQDIAAVAKKSAIYETQSWGKTDLPDYLNQVVMLQTELSAQQILEKILNIEIEMGRKREEKWGSRIIDIDILFYGSEIINEPNLTIPHPELHKRRFTLEPLEMLAPDFIHPILNKSILELKNDLKDDLIVKKIYF
jgi:2-amino-4-hydroxy-6-hydroxymethyldihydropteridine diphosphokinase